MSKARSVSNDDSVLTITGGSTNSNVNATGGAASATADNNPINQPSSARNERDYAPKVQVTAIEEAEPVTPGTVQFVDTSKLSPTSMTVIDGGDVASLVGGSPLGSVLTAASGTVSPVRSRDFAILSKVKTKEGKLQHTEGWIANQASPAGAVTQAVTHPAPGTHLPAEVSTSTAPTGAIRGRPTALANPRLKSLRNLVRASSEPNLARGDKEKHPDADIEKGITATTAGVGGIPAARVSEPALVKAPMLAGLLAPEKPLKPPPTWKTSAVNIAKYSYLNILLVFVPVAFACNYANVGSTAVFCVSFAAIIPLAALLGFATEELALRVGHTLGGLLNATLGNTVELIIAILALTKGELKVVQSSMIGSILSNCLLVLGCCFFAGGIRFHEQIYTIRSAQLNISLLGISALVIVIPAAFNASVSQLGVISVEASDRDILKISRGVAIILLFVYAAYLFFQLWTHSYLYRAQATNHRSTLHRTRTMEFEDEPQPPIDSSVLRMPSWHTSSGSDNTSTDSSSSTSSSSSDDEDAETPQLKVVAAIALILTVTVLCGLVAEFLVSSIDGLVAQGEVSREFVALILLPLVGNAAEHVTAVTVSIKDKLDLSLAVAIGSSIQIALFVIPFLVLLGWAIGQPLSLEFDVLETIILFVSIIIVNQAISDGKSNWLEGLVLMVVYLIIGLVVFFVPSA